MILVDEVNKDYLRCNSCFTGSKDGGEVKSITIGLNEYDTRSIRLCKKCREDLKKALERCEQV
ncbi:MAG: hypothetical protein ACQEXX_15900 [Bacillota bacterium]